MKHKLLITGLATATLLSTAALTHYSTSVYAEGGEPTGTVTKQDVAEYFTDLEKKAEEAINKNDKITDKEAAILEAKAAIGKEDLLKAIDEKQITPEDVLKDLAEASKTESDEAETGKYGENYAPQEVKDAKPAPGAELVRNESGEVTEVKPLNGGISEEVTAKINDQIDKDEKAVDDGERLKEVNALKKETEAALEAAKEDVEKAKAEKEKYAKELDSYKDAEGEQAEQYREAAKADLEKAEKALKEAEADKEALEEEFSKAVADVEAEEVRLLKRKIAKAKADGKDTKALEEELEIALNGVKPAVHELEEYKGELNPLYPRTPKPEPEKYPTPNPTPIPGTPAPTPTQTPAATPAPAPAQTPAATPAAEVPATPAEATSEEAAPVAVAAQAEESKKEELPNTGTAELGLFTPAVLSILAGLGLTFGKKEDK